MPSTCPSGAIGTRGPGGLDISPKELPGERRTRLLIATSFLVFGLSFLLMDVAVITHGGTLIAVLGVALTAVAGVWAAMAFFDPWRRRLWAAATQATFGTGLALGSIGLFSLAGAPTLGLAIALVFGPLFWVSAVLFVRGWLLNRSKSERPGG